MTNEEMQYLFEQGLEKIAEETEARRDPDKWQKRLAIGGAAAGAGIYGASFLNGRSKNLMNSLIYMKGKPYAIGASAAGGGLLTGAGAGIGAGLGTVADAIANRREKTASAYDLDPEQMQYLFEQGLEKIAEESYDPEFEESLVKVASYLGMDPEYTANALMAHREELIKVAEVENYIDTLNDDEVDALLKEAAANDSEAAAMIAAAEQEQENEELAQLAEMVDNLTDEEAEQLLASIQETKGA